MRLALFLAFATATFAQSVEVGVVQLTHVFDSKLLVPSETQHALPYVIGRKVEIHLWRPLYLDAEALSSHPNYVLPDSTLFIKRAIARWEAPILLTWTVNSHDFVRPFATAGVSFEHNLDTAIPPSASFGFGPDLPGSAGDDRTIAVSPPSGFDGTLSADTPPASFSTNNQLQLFAGLMF